MELEGVGEEGKENSVDVTKEAGLPQERGAELSRVASVQVLLEACLSFPGFLKKFPWSLKYTCPILTYTYTPHSF